MELESLPKPLLDMIVKAEVNHQRGESSIYIDKEIENLESILNTWKHPQKLFFLTGLTSIWSVPILLGCVTPSIAVGFTTYWKIGESLLPDLSKYVN